MDIFIPSAEAIEAASAVVGAAAAVAGSVISYLKMKRSGGKRPDCG